MIKVENEHINPFIWQRQRMKEAKEEQQQKKIFETDQTDSDRVKCHSSCELIKA